MKKLKTWWMQKCIELCVRLMDRYDLNIYRYTTGIEAFIRSKYFEELSSGCEKKVTQDNGRAILYEWKKNGITYRSWVGKENNESS